MHSPRAQLIELISPSTKLKILYRDIKTFHCCACSLASQLFSQTTLIVYTSGSIEDRAIVLNAQTSIRIILKQTTYAKA